MLSHIALNLFKAVGRIELDCCVLVTT